MVSQNRTTEADLKAAYTLDQRDEKIAILSQRCGAADKRVTSLERELVSVARGHRAVEGIPDRHPDVHDAFRALVLKCDGDPVALAALATIRKELAHLEVSLCLLKQSLPAPIVLPSDDDVEPAAGDYVAQVPSIGAVVKVGDQVRAWWESEAGDPRKEVRGVIDDDTHWGEGCVHVRTAEGRGYAVKRANIIEAWGK